MSKVVFYGENLISKIELSGFHQVNRRRFADLEPHSSFDSTSPVLAKKEPAIVSPAKKKGSRSSTYGSNPLDLPFKKFGISFCQNEEYRKTMEDEHLVVEAFGPGQSFFAVYDGTFYK